MTTYPLRQPAQVLHRIVVRDFDRCCHVEGVIVVTPDGTFREVEPFETRAMSGEELRRQLLEQAELGHGDVAPARHVEKVGPDVKGPVERHDAPDPCPVDARSHGRPAVIERSH